MSSNDLIHRFIFDDCDIRGEIVSLGESYRTILGHHGYPSAVERLLGEFLAAVSLLSSTLKFDGIISLQARGNGPITTIMAECTHHNNLRGIVQLKDEQINDNAFPQQGRLPELLGTSTLFITIEPKRTENFQGKLERYQGIVPMEKDSLAECLEDYFAQSEQLSTRLWLAADSNTAAGLLLQALPQQLKTNAEENHTHWESITTLAATITDNELLTLNNTDLLYRLFHEEALRLFEPRSLSFACSCSRERSAGALLSLGRDEVEELLIEKGSVDIDCQFCNQHYHFTATEVRELLGGDVLH